MAALVEHRNYLSDVLARQVARRRLADPGHEYAPQPSLWHHRSALPNEYAQAHSEAGPSKTAKGKAAAPSKDNVVNYIAAEEALRNDYAAWYGVSGQFPSNFVLGADSNEICEEFPALRRLMDLKAEQVAAVAHPPLYASLENASPSVLSSTLSPHRFDVILIHPPRSWSATAQLPIRQLSADPGFVFLWVGAGDAGGLERGRECLAKWGFRRAEDIVWVKTNKKGRTANGGGLFASQKEHCLMGIRGTVRRSTDSRFVHCNVDTDVIVWEAEEGGPRTPPYLYTLIENFCLGARRLELFNDGPTPRRGWVSAAVGPIPEGAQPFDGATYASHLPSKEEGKPVVPFHAEIDMLRPKSPQRRGRSGPKMPHGQGTASPPPSHTPPFRGPVMRMGALTPAQGYAGQYHQNQQPHGQHQHQHQHHNQHHNQHLAQQHHGHHYGAHGQAMGNMPMGMGMNVNNMNMPMNMGGMMPMNANMGMGQGIPLQNMQGVMPMQYQGMGMVPGMMPWGMGSGMMGMPMSGGMGMGGMGMGGMGMGAMGGMGGGMGGMPAMGGMGMQSMPMGMGMPGGMMVPGMSPPPVGSPQMGASPSMAPIPMEGSAATTTSGTPVPGESDEWHAHGHAMGQLAMSMGAMGMPYLGGGGYQYNG